MIDFFSCCLELLICPSVALFMMLPESNGFLTAAGGFAADPVMPKESMDPMRFWRAWSARVPPPAEEEAATGWVERRPSVLRLPIVRATPGADNPLAAGFWGESAATGAWGENGSDATGAAGGAGAGWPHAAAGAGCA